MVQHFYKSFLSVESEYVKAQTHWREVWELISQFDRTEFRWKSPWFPSSQKERDGNPIFTAISDDQMKAIRVIQHEPTSSELELGWWLDTFGGRKTDPFAIRELVIACSPSAESDQIAVRLMSSWVVGDIEVVRDARFAPTVIRKKSYVPSYNYEMDSYAA